LAETVAGKFKNRLTHLILTPSSGGRFEVRLNDYPVYSKAETGTFPDPDFIVGEVDRLLPPAS
jgi:selT/selW/selH-like putative selenoprotein